MTPFLTDTPLTADNGLQRPGTLALANESRFTAAHYSEPLTAFAVGWKDPADLRGLLEFTAPSVNVARRFEFKKGTNAEYFLSEDDDLRASGSSFKRIDYAGSSVNSKTHNKGLTIRIDHDDEAGDDWRERYTALLLQRLLRNELRRALTLLDAAATNADKTWPVDGTAYNPDHDIRNALTAAANVTGVRPNRVLIGEAAWEKRADSYAAQDKAGAFRSYGMTPQELAHRLLIADLRVVAARYQSAPTTKSRLVGSDVYAYYAQEGAMKDEPSNIKRFVTPTDEGPFRVYLDEHAKYTDLTVEHYSNLVITATDGIRKLTIS